VTNREVQMVHDFVTEATADGLAENLHPSDTLVEMVKAMPTPRAIIMMIPAGKPVDDTIATVHNGIEYADMQLIAEVYGLMRHGRGDAPADVGRVFEAWNQGRLQSYLVEISSKILQAEDRETGQPAVDEILDSAGQKGTGRWTAIEAIRMGESANVIEAAVAARAWSSDVEGRAMGAEIYGEARGTIEVSDEDLEAALLCGRIVSYAQGFDILKAASREFDCLCGHTERRDLKPAPRGLRRRKRRPCHSRTCLSASIL